MSPRLRKTLAPVLDRRGRFAPFKTLVFVALFVPAAWLTVDFANNNLGPRPVTEAIHQIGLWTLRYIFLSLAVTPAMVLFKWPRVLDVRRMVGVAAFAYVMFHLLLYVADQKFDLFVVASEIVLRVYLTIGFVAIVGLAALAVTSTDGWIRKLGGVKWNRLHSLIYPITLLSLIHFFMQSKANVWEPIIMAGLFCWLMGWRLLAAYARPFLLRAPVLAAAALTLAAALLTLGGEPLYFYLVSNRAPLRILNANLLFYWPLTPTWMVLGICAAVTLAAAIRLGAARLMGGKRLAPAE